MKYYERLLYLKNILIYLILFIKFPYFDFNQEENCKNSEFDKKLISKIMKTKEEYKAVIIKKDELMYERDELQQKVNFLHGEKNKYKTIEPFSVFMANYVRQKNAKSLPDILEEKGFKVFN